MPENEIHELALLYLNYELNLRGHQTIYLGQNLPLNNLNHFFKDKNELCFVTSLTTQPYEDKIDSYFKEIESALDKTKHKFIAIGRKTSLLKDTVSKSNISFFDTITDLINFI